MRKKPILFKKDDMLFQTGNSIYLLASVANILFFMRMVLAGIGEYKPIYKGE